ncbi:c-type cytochrome [Thiohalorhabdus sp. Cl-TMA]|uniref:Cytochrome c-551 n=1 Tax=Thiohalorhabdus methylotrophus TaxID=3242694 RepID=A0ABV4TVH3_9GAMM
MRTITRTAAALLAGLSLAACDQGGEPQTGGSQEQEQGTGQAPSGGGQDGGGGGQGASDGSAPGDQASPERQAQNQGGGTGAPAAGSGDTAPGEQAAAELGCTACHAEENKLVGPAYQDVAKRYNHDVSEILERMQAAVENGSSGNWTDVTGGTPMPPQPQAASQEKKLKQIAEWIAGMGR